MSSLPVAHLSRQLSCPPTVPSIPGVAVRNFAGEQDIEGWLELRRRALSSQTPAVRTWTRADFEAEFLNKPWWSPRRMWFAEAEEIVASVALALRGRLPVIHWLMVAPEWRRRGVGRCLLATLEAACWRAGDRKISLETHLSWTAAGAFYREMAYREGEATERRA